MLTGQATGGPDTAEFDVPAVAGISHRTDGALVRLGAFHSRTTGLPELSDHPSVASTVPPRLGPSQALSQSSASLPHRLA
jgi:hypothetical protein